MDSSESISPDFDTHQPQIVNDATKKILKNLQSNNSKANSKSTMNNSLSLRNSKFVQEDGTRNAYSMFRVSNFKEDEGAQSAKGNEAMNFTLGNFGISQEYVIEDKEEEESKDTQ